MSKRGKLQGYRIVGGAIEVVECFDVAWTEDEIVDVGGSGVAGRARGVDE